VNDKVNNDFEICASSDATAAAPGRHSSTLAQSHPAILIDCVLTCSVMSPLQANAKK
jgi:hypothetical protein